MEEGWGWGGAGGGATLRSARLLSAKRILLRRAVCPVRGDKWTELKVRTMQELHI